MVIIIDGMSLNGIKIKDNIYMDLSFLNINQKLLNNIELWSEKYTEVSLFKEENNLSLDDLDEIGINLAYELMLSINDDNIKVQYYSDFKSLIVPISG